MNDIDSSNSTSFLPKGFKEFFKSRLSEVLGIIIIIITLSIFFVYSSEQAKIRGEAFSKAIEFVQEDLRKTYHLFDSKVSMFNRGNISKTDFLKFAE